MKKRLFSIALACAAILPMSAKEKLNVLYVGGMPDFETSMMATPDQAAVEKSAKMRSADFTKFLKQRFTKVTSIDASQYSPEMSANYDVTVMDGKPTPIRPLIREMDERGNIVKYALPAYLPEDFDDAIVTIGEISRAMGSNVGSKNDWYCLCLNNYAHSTNFDHPIFKGPFKVDVKTEKRPTPAGAKDYAAITGEKLPAEIDMWMVTPDRYGERDSKNVRIGLVSRPGGYLDSPETEVISSGECAKSIDAIAIGRHANFFHWGWAAKPSSMTAEGRNAFANAIVYASKFKGQHPIARKKHETMATRHEVPLQKGLLTRESWQLNEKMNMDHYLMIDSIQKSIKARLAAGEDVPQNEQVYLQFANRKPEPVTYGQFLRSRNPSLYAVFGPDAEEYARYYDKNLPYFYCPEGSYDLVIDQEARELGIANNDIRILDEAIKLLEKGGVDAQNGKTILERYTLLRYETPAEWRAWFNKNKDNLFFSEGGGFKWLLNTMDPNEPTNDYSMIMEVVTMDGVKGPKWTAPKPEPQGRRGMAAQPAPAKSNEPTLVTDEMNPVALEARANGDEITLYMKVHDGYHTYAVVDPEDPFIQTTVSFELPNGMSKVGKLQLPASQSTANSTAYYVGSGKFTQKVSGKGDVKVKVRYQACNSNGCLRPTTKTLDVTVK